MEIDLLILFIMFAAIIVILGFMSWFLRKRIMEPLNYVKEKADNIFNAVIKSQFNETAISPMHPYPIYPEKRESPSAVTFETPAREVAPDDAGVLIKKKLEELRSNLGTGEKYNGDE